MKMKSHFWLVVRILIPAYVGYGVCFQPLQIEMVVSADTLQTLFAIFMPMAFFGALLYCRYGLAFVIRRQALQRVLNPPGWFVCPFQRSEPRQFFHLAAWLFLAIAVGTFVGWCSGKAVSAPVLGLGIVCGAFGAGMLAGLRWLVQAHPEYFVASGET